MTRIRVRLSRTVLLALLVLTLSSAGCATRSSGSWAEVAALDVASADTHMEFATYELASAKASGGSGGKTGETPASAADDLELMAKKSANPLSDVWMLLFQNDYSTLEGDALPTTKYINSLKFQPVMPVPLSEDWNLIVRPVLQFNSVPIDDDVEDLIGFQDDIVGDTDLLGLAQDPFGRTTGFGDSVLLTLVGPNRLDGMIWGVGISQIFPTAQEDVLGQGKWQAGPAAIVAHLAPDVGGFNIGALAQHWWSYSGDGDRQETSQTDIQYFINYRLNKTALVGMTPNIRINWMADGGDEKLTLPIGLGYIDIIKLGPLPFRIGIETQYSLFSPDNAGTDWNFRLIIAPIILNPLK